MNGLVISGLSTGGRTFPLVLTNTTPTATLADMKHWLNHAGPAIKERLAQCGALLLRDFPVNSDMDFDQVVACFGYQAFTYEESLSNAVRINRTPRVFTANEAPASEGIYLHNEMAQTPVFPTHLFFYCEQAAETQGETSLCPCDELYTRLFESDPEFVAACQDKGIKYTHIMPDGDNAHSGQGRGWQSTLGAKDKQAAELRLKQLGYSWTWLENDSLGATSAALPAVMQLKDGKRVFFNQLIAAHLGWGDVSHIGAKVVCYGDGSEIDDAQLQNVINLSSELTYDVAWQNGDLVLLDNRMAMHGRRPFTGKRSILASFAVE